MNYDHAFHAGNFADVVKHATFARVLLHLARKDKPFRVIDTHAGAGAYDLSGEAAARTGEWRQGVGRVAAIDPASPAGRWLAPWRALLGPGVAAGEPGLYPGSPVLAQRLLRPQDRAVFCELHAPTLTALRRTIGRDARVKCLDLDGWTALNAFTPPPERRGLVLVDPPFERPDEFRRLIEVGLRAHNKWPTGVYMLWHPVKDGRERDALLQAWRGAARNLLRLEWGVGAAEAGGRLARTGLLIANPPFSLADEMRAALPAIADALAPSGSGHACVEAFAA